jgi:hypothetical protein
VTALPGVFIQMVRADMLERVRRYSFLVTMLAAVYLGYLVYAGNITLTLDEYRGVLNSAWIGTMVALSSAFFIPLVGFYIVKNSISRDRTTRVGQILAGTPVGTFTYLLAKTASNFAVLASIVAVQVLAAILMQLLGPERGSIHIGQLVLPFVLITLPPIALVAATAVLFESVRWLSGGLGNILFFFSFVMLMSIPMANGVRELDPVGIGEVEESMHAGARAAYPEFKGGFQLQAAPKSLIDEAAKPKFFTWNGIDWTSTQVARRLWWFAAAFLLTLLAVPIFDRFDEAPAASRRRRRKPGKHTDPDAAASGNGVLTEDRPSGLGERIGRAISASSGFGASSRFGRLLAAEIRLTLKGVHTGWYLVAAGLALAGLLSPVDAVKHYLLPVAWIWPALIWSKMGMREAWFETGQLIFSAPRIRGAQLLAVWGSGVLVAALTGSGALLNFVIAGEWGVVPGVVAGMLFIPSLALACGVWSAGSKLFEALYVMWWYVGPMNHIPDLDFTGGSSTPATAAWYLAAAAIILLAADAGRRRQMAG